MILKYYIKNVLEDRHSIAVHKFLYSMNSAKGAIDDKSRSLPDMISKYRIVEVNTGKRRGCVYVLLGRVKCRFINGFVDKWFEIAWAPSREELEVWRDLHA